MDKKQKEKTETPIIDGDARPDMPVNAVDEKIKDKKDAKDKTKFETERSGDINTLEDYRDAK